MHKGAILRTFTPSPAYSDPDKAPTQAKGEWQKLTKVRKRCSKVVILASFRSFQK